MKGTIKRFTSLMLALLMTLALLPMEVLAAENVSDFTQLTELTSEAQIASTPAIQPLADAATAVPATFSVGSQTYSDLNDAITAAQSGTDKTIVVATDGSLSGSYTIPAGVTLLVPFDDANTLYKETPTATRKAAAAKAYRKLVLAADAALTVEGAISVGGQYYSAGGSQIGGMVGNYGHLWLNTGAAITVKSGGLSPATVQSPLRAVPRYMSGSRLATSAVDVQQCAWATMYFLFPSISSKTLSLL